MLLLSFHLRLVLPSDLSPSGFLTNNLYPFLSHFFHACYMTAHIIPLHFITLVIFDVVYTL